MPVRLKDIARDLGVSTVTVSKVLRNHKDISEETRQRVLRRMKELDYQPNFAARALITGKSHTVGLVVPDLLHPFFAQVAQALAGTLRQKGYGLLIASSEEDTELERQEIESLLSRRVDAIVVASAQWSVESFRRIEQHNTPYVLIDRSFVGLTANFVGVDDHLAGSLATTHLIQQGCRRIAHIKGPEVSTSIGRFEGYKRALADHGRVWADELVVPIGDSGDARGDVGGYDVTRGLLGSEAPPDGIFCYNDPVALGCMRAILDAGLQIPQDIAVVGCGNLLYSDFLRVPLSTIDQNSAKIGGEAGELALRLIETAGAASARPVSVLIQPKLCVRASSQRTSLSI